MTDEGPSRTRTVALAGARAAGALAAIGVAIVTVGAAVVVPLPSLEAEAPSTVVTPVPTPQSLVCPGAFLRLGNAQGQEVTTATGIGTPTLGTGGEPTLMTLAGAGEPTGLTSGEDPGVLVSGSQVQQLGEGDVTGLAVASCANVSADTWLVGGSNTVGRTTLVSLANPSEVSATVSLELWGEAGAIQASGASGIVVAARSQRIVALSGLARDVASPVVHVESTGGLIAASMQQSIVRGLEPAGADLIAATTGPSASLVIPGVVVSNQDPIENRIAADSSGGSADLAGIVRLLAPGSEDATATVNVVPVGRGTGASFDLALTAGVVQDVPIEGLGAGEYTVTVQSSAPVVGAVRVSTASRGEPAAGTSDLAWVAAPPRFSTATSVTVVGGPSPALHIANPTDTTIEATVIDASGSTRTLALPPGVTRSIRVAAGSYRLEGNGPLVADVSYASPAQLGVFPVQPRVADADPVRVYP